MLELLLFPKAEKDLEEIFDYRCKTWRISQAEKYQDELFESMKIILKTPHKYTVFDAISKSFLKVF